MHAEINLTVHVLCEFNCSEYVTYRCSAVDTDYICYRTPDIRFLYQYPQNIPGLSLSARSVEIGFIFLRTVNPPLSKECEVALQHIMCLGSTPPCSPESKLLLAVCPNSCNAYNRLLIEGNCSSVTDYARQLQAQSNLEDFQIFLELLLNFDCSDSSTYIFYEYEYIDQNECTDLFGPGETGEFLGTIIFISQGFPLIEWGECYETFCPIRTKYCAIFCPTGLIVSVSNMKYSVLL